MLILGSSSPYRRALLERLGLSFRVEVPDVDESPLVGETPAQTSVRLALAKAQRVGARCPDDLIIGCDQVAVLQGEPVGKPHTRERAVAQLMAASGQEMVFHTALCLWEGTRGLVLQASVPTWARMRNLTRAQIERYLDLDRPYDCAGSTKIEAAGIALMEWVRSDDPTALVGLPMVALTRLLEQAGVFCLGPP